MICNLCKKKEEVQTGSHITSAFLLTSQIGNINEERSFLITTNLYQDYSQKQGDVGLKEEFLFCRACENSLGLIEGIYASEITHNKRSKEI
jgi:hypothetical protein